MPFKANYTPRSKARKYNTKVIAYEKLFRDSGSDLDFKLVDFGLGIKLKTGEKLNLRCGSPGYAAPEVLMKESYDYKCDVFSCGIILYVL